MPTKQELQVARCEVLDAFSHVERALRARLQVECRNTPVGQLLLRLAEGDLEWNGQKLSKALGERVAVRNDLVHSEPQFMTRKGDGLTAFYTNNCSVEPYPQLRPLSLAAHQRLREELTAMAKLLR